MWKCKGCSETNEDSSGRCWYCGTGKDGSPPPKDFRRNSAVTSHTDCPQPPVAGSKSQEYRYNDAYLVAKALWTFGEAIKYIGLGLGAIILIAAVIIAAKGGGALVFVCGVLLGLIVAIPICILGVLLTAQAQVLRATLDTAVHTSPFLTKEGMARAMYL